ncbi:glycosyltransferase family 2 protein [Arachidicoccus soli]|uniref:Glycosyltransferase n=1 Tax=Arachidicoccus soli TaxID=2341117 RepID=A0A386HQY5_9BACT|nr:glycosyltransferase family A protein [Arachidicoccus soli]AYD47986.1 glycosyltransferase [Arachidicoccus soli]
MLLSIVVPTKNRSRTLHLLIEALIAFNDKDMELVIHDNSDNNAETVQFLLDPKYASCKNLKYIYCPGELSVIKNSDLAVANATGEYICFIGDDDGVLPIITNTVRWMKEQNISVLKTRKAAYSWPGMQKNILNKNASGILSYSSFNYGTKSIDSEVALKYSLNKGGTSMLKLPCLYHGIVHHTILDRIYQNCGSFFPASSPDMANAIALIKFVSSFTYLDIPIIISGKSVSSTGGLGVLHKHIAKIEDVKHLPKNVLNSWPNFIPRYWTGQTIWAESLLNSLKNCGDSESQYKFNYSYLYAYIMVYDFKFRKIIFSDAKIKIYSLAFYINILRLFLKRVYEFLYNRTLKYSTRNNIKTIGAAIDYIQREIELNKLPF